MSNRSCNTSSGWNDQHNAFAGMDISDYDITDSLLEIHQLKCQRNSRNRYIEWHSISGWRALTSTIVDAWLCSSILLWISVGDSCYNNVNAQCSWQCIAPYQRCNNYYIPGAAGVFRDPKIVLRNIWTAPGRETWGSLERLSKRSCFFLCTLF